MVVLDISSGDIKNVSSPVQNLHGLLKAGPSSSQLWGIGHESPELMDVFDRQLNRLETRSYRGLMFRGHGISWNGGVLVAAEALQDPMAGGLLVELDASGNVLQQHPSGGLRPHEIVQCGDYLAVAHYGHKPTAGPTQGAQVGYGSGGPSLLFDTVSPGVSILRRDTLEVVAFHRTPGNVATTHLGVTAQGQVLCMGINTQRASSESVLYALAERDEATLLMSELYERGYEVCAPMHCIDPKAGIIATVEQPATRMRRGQSFAHDTKHGLLAATFAASQTLYLQLSGQGDQWLNTLELGVPNPRGCAVLPGGRFVAVSGNEDNIAIVDVLTGKLQRLFATPLGGHSHMFWVED
jgi:hypothetical protein